MRGFRIHARLALALLVALVAVASARAESLAQHLKDTYQNKNWFLANFYGREHLRYDSNGDIVGSVPPGVWTVDGYVEVTGVEVSGEQMRITAQRLVLFNEDGKGFRFLPTKRKLTIEVTLDPQHMAAQDLDAVWGKIFIIRGKRFVEMVPDYWKPCVSAAVGTIAAGYKACRFAQGYSGPAIDQTLPTSPAPEPNEDDGPFMVEGLGLVYRSGKNKKEITPPKAIYAPDPDYSEQARHDREQGAVVLRVLVDATGKVGRIRIVRPLGYGLDEQAVLATTKWKFEPARKGGIPVPVEISVQVEFRLY